MAQNKNILYYSSSNEPKYYDQSFVTLMPNCPIYSQPPNSIVPSYNTTVPLLLPWNYYYYYYYYMGFAFAYNLAPTALTPYYLFGFDDLNVPLYYSVPVPSAAHLLLMNIQTETRLVEKPNWLDLPDDITANILHRLGAIQILKNAQKVCKAWCRICEDPAMWRVVYIQVSKQLHCEHEEELEEMCRQAIDRSQGQLVDINIERIASAKLFKYLAGSKRSSQLKRLQIAWSTIWNKGSWIDFFRQSPLLEEISLAYTDYISKETLSNAGQYCLKLKSFKYHQKVRYRNFYGPEFTRDADDFVIAITKSMPQLRHLELVGSKMTNAGLQAILDGCPHLVSLNLRRCFNINLDSSCGELCIERIKDLRLPYDRYGRP